MKTIELHEGFKIKLNNDHEIEFLYFSYFDNPIFRLDDSKYKVTIIDNMLYSASQDDEPSCPLREEYQTAFLKEYDFDFFKGNFIEKKEVRS